MQDPSNKKPPRGSETGLHDEYILSSKEVKRPWKRKMPFRFCAVGHWSTSYDDFRDRLFLAAFHCLQ